MKYTLHGFEIHGVDGFTNVHFVIEADGKKIKFDEALKRENKIDVELLQAIDCFIRSKDVSK